MFLVHQLYHLPIVHNPLKLLFNGFLQHGQVLVHVFGLLLFLSILFREANDLLVLGIDLFLNHPILQGEKLDTLAKVVPILETSLHDIYLVIGLGASQIICLVVCLVEHCLFCLPIALPELLTCLQLRLYLICSIYSPLLDIRDRRHRRHLTFLGLLHASPLDFEAKLVENLKMILLNLLSFHLFMLQDLVLVDLMRLIKEHVKQGPHQADIILFGTNSTSPSGFLVSLIDDSEEDVGENEHEEDVEGEEVEDCDHWVSLIELIEVEFPKRHLEVHA
jgi:hypothetical protein